MRPPKLFKQGDRVRIDYADEHYEAVVICAAPYPAGTWMVRRRAKRQRLPEGWGLEDARVETVAPQFMSRIVGGE